MHLNLENLPANVIAQYDNQQLELVEQTKSQNPKVKVKTKARSNSSPDIKFTKEALSKYEAGPDNKSNEVIGNKSSKTPVAKSNNAMDVQSNSVIGLQMAEVENNNNNNDNSSLIKKNTQKFITNQKVKNLRARKLKEKNAFGIRKGPQSLDNIVRHLIAARPNTPDEFKAALAGITLDPDVKLDKSALAVFQQIACHCVRNTGAKAQERQESIKTLGTLFQDGDNANKLAPYPHLNSSRVGFDLIKKIVNPGTIDQGAYGTCGPTAVAMYCAKEMPWAFSTAAVQLARTGKAKLGKKGIVVREDIRNHKPDPSVSDGDWLMVSALANKDSIKASNNQTWGATGLRNVHELMVEIGIPTVFAMPAYENTKAKSMVIAQGRARGTKVNGPMTWMKRGYLKSMGHVGTKPMHHPSRPNFVAQKSSKQDYLSTNNLDKAKEMLDNGLNVFIVASEAFDTKGISLLRDLGKPVGDQTKAIVNNIKNDPVAGHWIKVNNIQRNNGEVTLSISTHGKEMTMPPVPENEFFKIYGGFIGASDVPVKQLEQNWNKGNNNNNNASNNWGWRAKGRNMKTQYKKNNNNNNNNLNDANDDNGSAPLKSQYIKSSSPDFDGGPNSMQAKDIALQMEQKNAKSKQKNNESKNGKKLNNNNNGNSSNVSLGLHPNNHNTKNDQL